MQRALRPHDNQRKASSPGHGVARQLGAAALWVALAAPPARATTITDGADRTVKVPAGVARVVPAGPPAQVLLQALAPDLLAGLVEPFKPEHAIYVDSRLARLPQIPMLSRTDAAGDVAEVAALKPGLCVDYGNVSARYTAATEKIADELKIPAAIFAGDLAQTGGVVRTLGGALGAQARTADVEKAVTDALAMVKPVSGLQDADRTAVYIARGTDGLNAMRAGSSFDDTVRLAGGRNVVTGSGGTFRHLGVADVVALKPAVVVFGDIEALFSPLHDALPKSTTFVLDTGEPYKVVVGPPSINRIVGVVALAAILHPDKVKPDADTVRRLETALFPLPPGVAVPSPLQVRR